MKVVLAKPNYASPIITPPLGLGDLAAFLKKNQVDTIIIDAVKEGMDNTQLVDFVIAQLGQGQLQRARMDAERLDERRSPARPIARLS